MSVMFQIVQYHVSGVSPPSGPGNIIANTRAFRFFPANYHSTSFPCQLPFHQFPLPVTIPPVSPASYHSTSFPCQLPFHQFHILTPWLSSGARSEVHLRSQCHWSHLHSISDNIKRWLFKAVFHVDTYCCKGNSLRQKCHKIRATAIYPWLQF